MKKVNNKKGFTLAELLVVIAIIAILIAIAIPTFSGALDGAKKATDDANIRAAFAQYQVACLTAETPVTGVAASQSDVTACFIGGDVDCNGTLTTPITVDGIGVNNLQHYGSVVTTVSGWSGDGDGGHAFN